MVKLMTLLRTHHLSLQKTFLMTTLQDAIRYNGSGTYFSLPFNFTVSGNSHQKWPKTFYYTNSLALFWAACLSNYLL